MKNGPVFLLGLFTALAISFGGLVLGSHAQLGRLAPYYDDVENQSFPQRTSGIAARGLDVYTELGCAACHTQQVRRPDYGSDQARGWGERQSVARDYIFQARPQLGALRLGPDLTNFAARKVKKPEERDGAVQDLYRLLYQGTGTHPAYKFLFDERKIMGEPALDGLKDIAPAAALGSEIVPTERARTLVTYLLSLNNAYDYPESRPVAPAQAAPVPPHGQEKPVPAAAPDEKKKLEQKQ